MDSGQERDHPGEPASDRASDVPSESEDIVVQHGTIDDMDTLRLLHAAVSDTRIRAGDAVLAFIELQREIIRSRRLFDKLMLVAPELVEAALLEISQEDDEGTTYELE